MRVPRNHLLNTVRLGLPVLALCIAVSVQAQNTPALPAFKSPADFEACVNRRYHSDDCLTALEKRVRVAPKEAMQAGKLVRLHLNAAASLRFFETASKHKPPGFCQDSDLQLAVVSGLALPGDYPDAQRASKIFANFCFAEQVAAVAKEVSAESGNSYLKTNACPLLQLHKQAPASCQPQASAQTDAAASAVEKLPTIDKSTITLGSIKVYRGPEGERVTMAPIQGTDLYLIRFDGVTGAWNGKAVLHKRLDRGNDAADFWTESSAGRWTSVVRRAGMEVYVPGYKSHNGFSVGYSDKLTQEAAPEALLAAYQP